MAFIEYCQLPDARGPAKDILKEWEETQGKRSLLFEMLANHPPLLQGYMALFEGVMESGTLDRELAELVAVAVSQTNECDYCISSHVETFVEVFDFPQSKVDAIRAGEYDSLSTAERVAVEFAVAAATDATRVGQRQVDALLDAGFTESEVLQITGVVGMFMAANTMTDALGVSPADRDGTLEDYLE